MDDHNAVYELGFGVLVVEGHELHSRVKTGATLAIVITSNGDHSISSANKQSSESLAQEA